MNQVNQFSLRALFLFTTVVAVVVSAFTLGTAEGVLILLLLPLLREASKDWRRWWRTGLLLLAILLGTGIYPRRSMQFERGRPNDGMAACIDVWFTGNTLIRQEDIYKILQSEFSSETNLRIESMSANIPFFRTGYIKLSFDRKNIHQIEARVHARISKAFPSLNVPIEGHVL